jgi:hypothetical protein
MMTAIPLTGESRPSFFGGSGSTESVQWYARLAGILTLISLVAGAFGEGYVPAAVVASGDAAATAKNLLEHETLFRWGFVGYLIEAICDAMLTMVFWVILRPVHRNLAMLMVVFRIIATCGFATAQVLYFGAFSVLHSSNQLGAFGPDQLQALSFALIKIAFFGGQLFTTFYGLGSIVFGYLLVRSLILPRFIGVLWIIMGVAFALRTFLLVLAPAYASPLLLATAALALLPLMVWLLVKGVNVERWRAYAADSR